MAYDSLSDATLSKLCDTIENTLEEIVIQFRGQFFEEGMESKLRAQFEARLSTLISKKGGNFENLSKSQKEYVQDRIERSLELFKKEYESH